MKDNFPRIVLSIIEVIVGILLLVDPVGFTMGIIMILGIVLIVVGIVEIIQYFRCSVQEAMQKKSLSVGILAILLGLWCCFRSDWFISMFPVLTTLYGVILLISGVVKIQWTADFLRLKRKKWWGMGISALFTLICAVLILANPFGTTTVLWNFIGITLIIEAVLDIISIVLNRKGADVIDVNVSE